MTEPLVDAATHAHVMAEADRIIALGESASRDARDPVNQPTINTWIEAMGDRNPVYTDAGLAAKIHDGAVAPPAMAQVWTMYGLDPTRPADDPLHSMMGILTDAGFTSVIASNSDQEYLRYLKVGEQVRITNQLESVVGPKETSLGVGYFVTNRANWYVGDELVATMAFRVLKFRPKAKAAEKPRAQAIRPMINRDSEFFWEGTKQNELRIQKCNACGALRHPPGPTCPHCHAMSRDWIAAKGTGEIYSYVIHRHPAVPGKELPIVIALVELDEGVRMIGEMPGVDEADVEIGARVEVLFTRIDDELTLPHWKLAENGVQA